MTPLKLRIFSWGDGMRFAVLIMGAICLSPVSAYAQVDQMEVQRCVWRCGADNLSQLDYNSCSRSCLKAVPASKRSDRNTSSLEGEWASSIKECRSDEPTEYIFFRGNKYGGYEFGCTVKTSSQGANRFSVQGNCEYGDEKWKIALNIKKEQNRISISDRKAGAPSIYYFCENKMNIQ